MDAVTGPARSLWDGGIRSELDSHVAFGGLAANRKQRHLLLPALHALQDRIGYVSPQGLGYICTRLGVPPAEAFGVASAYAMIWTKLAPTVVLHVCDDVACQAGDRADPCARIESVFGPEHSEGNNLMWVRSPCLGRCDSGSAAVLQIAGEQPRRVEIAPLDDGALATLSAAARSGSGRVLRSAGLLPSELGRSGFSLPQAEHSRDSFRLLRRVGVVEPGSLDSYLSLDGYQPLRRAIELGRAGVIAELIAARLLGRGGAAFPTGVKWQAVANNSEQPHYFVCNADESEPGTFKDRILIEHDPFAIIEALTIAGYATGSDEGYIYVRGEYPSGERRLIDAAHHARSNGYLGNDVLGAGFQFDIEVRRGAGAYIAGEETALFNSIEGKRPEPRNKPPFPTQAGLFGKPTGVNNAETLLNVLEIMRAGGAEFARQGTSESTGTRLFCLSGAIARPGLYEAPFGITLRELLALAGGVRKGHETRAILLGGAAGSFLGPNDLDIELSFEGARSAGASLGSGVVMVFDETADFGAIVTRIARFFRDESCGQCVPCRVGTVRQEELVARLIDGQLLGTIGDELALLADLSSVMRDASICGLGQTATSAVESAIRLGLVSVPEHGS